MLCCARRQILSAVHWSSFWPKIGNWQYLVFTLNLFTKKSSNIIPLNFQDQILNTHHFPSHWPPFVRIFTFFIFWPAAISKFEIILPRGEWACLEQQDSLFTRNHLKVVTNYNTSITAYLRLKLIIISHHFLFELKTCRYSSYAKATPQVG